MVGLYLINRRAHGTLRVGALLSVLQAPQRSKIMYRLMIMVLLVCSFVLCGSGAFGAVPLHRLLSGDKYYVVYSNNAVVEYDFKNTRIQNTLNDDTKRFGPYPELNAGERVSRVVAAVPGKYVIVGCIDEATKSMPLWKCTLPAKHWLKITDGVGFDSAFAVACNENYVVGAPIDNSKVFRYDIVKDKITWFGTQPINY